MLGATLRLSHPVLPHVTERIWGELDEQGVLARASWPEGAPRAKAAAEDDVDEAFAFVGQAPPAARRREHACRARRSWCRAGRSPASRPCVESLGGVSTDGAGDLGELRAVDAFTVGTAPVTVLAPGGAENLRPRFERELAKAEEEAGRARRKLADARFVERAPAHLVEAEREKAERFEREAAELRARLADLGA